MKDWRATVLGASGIVVITISLGVGQMTLGDEMSGTFRELDGAGHDGQDHGQGTEFGEPDSHCTGVYARTSVGGCEAQGLTPPTYLA